MLGKIEGRRRGQQRIRELGGITDLMDMSLSKLWETVKDREPGTLQSMGSQRIKHELATKQQQTGLKPFMVFITLRRGNYVWCPWPGASTEILQSPCH